MTKWKTYLLYFLVLPIAVASCQPIRPVAPSAAEPQPAVTAVASTEITATTPMTTVEVITQTAAVATNVTTNTVSADTVITDTAATDAATDAATEILTATTTSTSTLSAPTLIPTPTPTIAATEPTTQTADLGASPAAPTNTQAVTNTAPPSAGGPVATVAVPSLRIRSGPSVDYEIVGAARQGDVLVVLGQVNGCEWLRIEQAQLSEAWVAGGLQFVTISVDCAQIPEAPIPTQPAASAAEPAAEPAVTAESPAEPTATTPPPAEPTPTVASPDTAAQPTPTVAAPEPTATPAPAAADPFPADKGCYLIQNQLGPELTFTVTSEDGSWNETFKVGPSQELPYCLAPGKYRVTVDAPPPWADLNQEITVNAGDRFYFPIRAQ